MTATERLRAMLDERGAEWGASDTYRLLVTSWKDANGHSWAFMEHRDGNFSKLTAYHLTPEQAVEATLGEEIVRCRDCQYAELDDSGRSYYKDMLWCSELGGDDSMPVEPDGFCAWGERK